MILCNCCHCDNAPLALVEQYWICDDCVEKYGSYKAALEYIKNRWSYVQKNTRVADNKPQDNIQLAILRSICGVLPTMGANSSKDIIFMDYDIVAWLQQEEVS